MPDNDSDKKKPNEEEEDEKVYDVIDQCHFEGRVRRGLPAAALAGCASYLLIRRGVIVPQSRFAPWSLVIPSALIAYYAGKTSYVLGSDCKERILREAPDSEIAYVIRKERGLPQTKAAMEKYGSGDSVEYKQSSQGYVLSMFTNERLTLDESKLSPKEREILQDCEDCEFFFFCSPLSILFGSIAWYGQRKGRFKESRRLKPPFAKLPKIVMGMFVGFMLGKFAYLNTSDCALRFTTDAPEGEVAKLINQRYKDKMKDFEIPDSKPKSERDIYKKTTSTKQTGDQPQHALQNGFIVKKNSALQGLGLTTVEDVLAASVTD